VREVVDLIWEAVRMRRLKATLMTSSAADGMMAVLHGLTGASATRPRGPGPPATPRWSRTSTISSTTPGSASIT
jgi:hypothetical protein